jgi:hypothetical protein
LPNFGSICTTVLAFGLLAPTAELATIASAQAAACIMVKTPADLDAVRADLAGHYCLVRDIDMSRFGDFKPLGELPSGDEDNFVGTFDGRGHTIRNLTITSAGDEVGLFADINRVGDQIGSVKRLTLQNAQVHAVALHGASVGALAGFSSGKISDVHVSGAVTCEADQDWSHNCTAGGLIGRSLGTISRTSAAVAVTVGAAGTAGGLVGELGGSIARSYATGTVSLVGDSQRTGNAGGLVGWSERGRIAQSFATGPVSLRQSPDTSYFAGGLVGYCDGGTIVQSFATGSVESSPLGIAGGLTGYHPNCPTREAYALGRVIKTTDASTTMGGLVGKMVVPTMRQGYWDVDTSGQTFSAAGRGKTTRALQARLPRGFRATGWAVTPGVSFPYLTAAGLNFAAPLAITVKGNLLYTFLPISQLDLSQYAATVTHADEASLAAAYTIIARAVGETDDVVRLKDVAIDTYFWNDAAQTAKWRGPVTRHAARGPLNAVAPAVKLDDSNVIGALRAREAVLLRGKYRAEAGGKATQWMVATSFTTDADGNVTAVVADDPWTGLQVRIDPATKQVVAPADFPLAHFTVNAFQTVTLN